MSRPRQAPTFVCLQCGTKRMTHERLESHWRLNGHGPYQAFADAVDRARWSIMGNEAPPPEPVESPDDKG